MPNETLTITPVNGTLGAEVSGVDLSKPLGNQIFSEVHKALMDHQVIFFRDQDLTMEQHKDFGRMFGELHVHPASPSPEGHPEILVVHGDENSKYVAGHGWHSDVSCDAEPPMGSILRMVTVPPAGGDTIFASMYSAYDALSDQMRDFLDGLTAVHSSEHVYRGRYGITENLRDGNYPQSEHPVVRTHPVTQKKSLYVNSGFTTRIKGMKEKESRAVLGFLFDHIATTPEFQMRFQWRENSIAFWDNRAVQHHSVWDYFPNVRHGYRVTVKGDRPFH
jgi:taurine dioxygenase